MTSLEIKHIQNYERARNDIIDVAKGITIFLVVLGHLQTDINSKTVYLISACHMPVFFFLSGLFFGHSYEKYDTKQFWIGKCKRLFFPYIIWSTVSFVFNAGIMCIQGSLSGIAEEAYEIYINARSVWFLIVLFITNMLCWCIRKVSFNKRVVFYFLCAFCWGVLIIIGNGRHVKLLSYFKLEWLFIYYILGVLFVDCFDFFSKLMKLNLIHCWMRFVCAVCAMLLYIVLAFLQYDTILFGEFYVLFNLKPEHTVNYIFYYFVGGIGISMIVLFAAWINDFKIGKMIRIWGKYSMDIYVIHMFIVKALSMFILRESAPVFLTSQLLLISYAFIIVVGISISVQYVLSKISLYKMSLGQW